MVNECKQISVVPMFESNIYDLKLPPGWYYGMNAICVEAKTANGQAEIYGMITNQRYDLSPDTVPAIFAYKNYELGKTDVFYTNHEYCTPILSEPIYLQNPYLHFYASNSTGNIRCTIFYKKTYKRYEQ